MRSEVWYPFEEVVQSVCSPETQEVVQSEPAGPPHEMVESALCSPPRLWPQ